MPALVAQVPVELNNVPYSTITKVNAKPTKQVSNKYGAYGYIGAAKGQEKGTFSLSLAVPKTGLEADFQALDTDDGFTITYSMGTMRYMLLNCHWTEESLDNDPEAGNTDYSVSGTYGQRVRIA
jgi:hypothetical protein